MKWKLVFLPEAIKDIEKLDSSQRYQVIKGINKVLTNPLSKANGGYGTPLGNRNGINLSGYYKIKFKKSGLRVVYKIIQSEDEMLVIIVSTREGNNVYKEAARRVTNKKGRS